MKQWNNKKVSKKSKNKWENAYHSLYVKKVDLFALKKKIENVQSWVYRRILRQKPSRKEKK